MTRVRERASLRVGWADSAKGLSILGVCLLHVVTSVPDAMTKWWGELSLLLDPLRMPLFFLVSGLFAHRVIQRNLGDLWRRRIWFLLVPYLVYSPVHAYLRLDMYAEATADAVVKAVLLGDPGLWFLYTLILYNVSAVLLRHQPPLVALLLSVFPALVAAMSGLMVEQSFRQSLIYAPLFFLGLHFRIVIFALSRRAFTLAGAVFPAMLFAASEKTYRFLDTEIFQGWNEAIAGQSAVALMVRALAAVPFGVVVAVWLSHVPLLGSALATVGRNTLPIYVSHHAALMIVEMYAMPEILDSHPGLVDYWNDVDVRIYAGFTVCAVAGLVFYALGRTPVLKWTLYPPALRATH